MWSSHHCGGVGSCLVVNWAKAKGQWSSQVKVGNFYHHNEAVAKYQKDKQLCQSRKWNQVKGRDSYIRILLLTFFCTIYQTKHKCGVSEPEVNLTPRQKFLVFANRAGNSFSFSVSRPDEFSPWKKLLHFCRYERKNRSNGTSLQSKETQRFSFNY